jgi:hypothetical protein
MGLDMYLEKHTYVQNWDHMKDDEKTTITISGARAKDIKPERVTYIIEQVAYWRKANAIHQWFIDHCASGTDDCQPVYVSREQLQELYELAQGVLANPSDGPEVLPTQDGFFFGSTEYDEYYLQDMEETVRQLKVALAEDPDGWGSYYYRASW